MEEKEKHKASSEKKRSGLFRIYRTFVCYVVLIGFLQSIGQMAVLHAVKGLPQGIAGFLMYAANVVIIAALILILGWRYYRHLRRISDGVGALSRGEPVHLPEEGVTEELARSINQTSEMLEEQQKMISQRDTARMDWIRGVSHDIRTPLSMVMGYSELLEEEPLTAEQQRSVAIIKEQSVKMRALIEDLNLTSKLEYDRQPLRLVELSPAEVLREAVASAINSGYFAPEREEASGCIGGSELAQNEEGGDILEKYRIDLLILPEFERLKLRADRNLLRRVFDNLIGNAVRHNPNGCSIMIIAYCAGGNGIVEIRDDGVGVPDTVARILNAVGSEFSMPDEEAGYAGEDGKMLPDRPHIMGMRIAKQIMLAHGGNLFVKPDRHTVEIVLRGEEAAERKGNYDQTGNTN